MFDWLMNNAPFNYEQDYKISFKMEFSDYSEDVVCYALISTNNDTEWYTGRDSFKTTYTSGLQNFNTFNTLSIAQHFDGVSSSRIGFNMEYCNINTIELSPFKNTLRMKMSNESYYSDAIVGLRMEYTTIATETRSLILHSVASISLHTQLDVYTYCNSTQTGQLDLHMVLSHNGDTYEQSFVSYMKYNESIHEFEFQMRLMNEGIQIKTLNSDMNVVWSDIGTNIQDELMRLHDERGMICIRHTPPESVTCSSYMMNDNYIPLQSFAYDKESITQFQNELKTHQVKYDDINTNIVNALSDAAQTWFDNNIGSVDYQQLIQYINEIQEYTIQKEVHRMFDDMHKLWTFCIGTYTNNSLRITKLYNMIFVSIQHSISDSVYYSLTQDKLLSNTQKLQYRSYHTVVDNMDSTLLKFNSAIDKLNNENNDISAVKILLCNKIIDILDLLCIHCRRKGGALISDYELIKQLNYTSDIPERFQTLRYNVENAKMHIHESLDQIDTWNANIHTLESSMIPAFANTQQQLQSYIHSIDSYTSFISHLNMSKNIQNTYSLEINLKDYESKRHITRCMFNRVYKGFENESLFSNIGHVYALVENENRVIMDPLFSNTSIDVPIHIAEFDIHPYSSYPSGSLYMNGIPTFNIHLENIPISIFQSYVELSFVCMDRCVFENGEFKIVQE